MARPELKTREVTGYLRPMLAAGFNKMIEDKTMGKSEALNDAVALLLEKNGYGIHGPQRGSKKIY